MQKIKRKCEEEEAMRQQPEEEEVEDVDDFPFEGEEESNIDGDEDIPLTPGRDYVPQEEEDEGQRDHLKCKPAAVPPNDQNPERARTRHSRRHTKN